MAKDRTNGSGAIQKVTPPDSIPDYLRNVQDDSLTTVQEHRILSRVKIIQSTASSDLKKNFDEGDIIIHPGGVCISKVDKKEQRSVPFLFAPLFFFEEYCKWSDLKDKQSPTILARTFDKGSDIASYSRDAEKRFEKYGNGYVARYVEHLNFAGYLYAPETQLHREACVLSFQRGEHGKGKMFCTSVSMRRTPLWSQVWSFRSGYRDPDPDRKWWGLDFEPAESPNIGPDEVEWARGQYEDLKKLHAERRLVVDRSDKEGDPEDTNDKTTPM